MRGSRPGVSYALLVSDHVNPPFVSIMHEGKKKGPTAWIRKAIAEARKGKTVVLVLFLCFFFLLRRASSLLP